MRFEGRRVYLTGATGFIGGVVARRLAEEGAELTCLVRPGTPAGDLERMGARVVRGNVTEPATLDLKGQDVVVHAAAWVGFGLPGHKRPLLHRTNVGGTENVLHAAQRAGVPKLVHVSSVAALGASAQQPATEDAPRPDFFKSDYERSKTAAHALALHAPVPTALPMPGLVIGARRGPLVGAAPGSPGAGRNGPFDWLLRALARGRLPALPGDDAVKGWVHVEDAAEGILLCALKGKGPYLLVDENVRTTEMLVMALEEAGLPIPRRRVPSRLLVMGGAVVERGYNLARRTPPVSEELLRSLTVPMSYDSARARRELGWRPELVKRLAADLQAYAR